MSNLNNQIQSNPQSGATDSVRISTSRSWRVGVLAIFAAIIAIMTIVLSANKFSEIRQNWIVYDQGVEPKLEALAGIRKHMGYGGLIHAFKNYVLRADERYYLEAWTHMDQAKTEIETYLVNQTSETERSSLQTIGLTIDRYRENLNKARLAIATGIEPRNLDALVKVDDTSAYEAMFVLEGYLQMQHMHHGESVMRSVNDGAVLMNVSSFALPFAGLSALYIIWSLLRLQEQARSMSAHLRAVVDNAFDAIVTYDQDGAIHSVNPRTAELFGYGPDELRQKSIEMLLPEAVKGKCALFVGAEAQTDVSSTQECMAETKTGHEFPVELAVTDIENDERQLRVAFIRDITKRKMSERALEQMHGRLETVLKSSPAVIYTASPDRVSQKNYVSENISDLFGYSPADVINKTNFWHDLIHPEDCSVLFMANRKLKTQGKRIAEYRVLLADGTWRWVHDEALVVSDRSEQSEIVGSIIDITERKKAEHERIMAQSALLKSQKMEALGQLSGGMAHEFNNMLVPMICLTELTMDDLPPDSIAWDNLSTSLDAALKARSLIEQILAYARSENRMFEDILIKGVIIQSVKMLRASLPTNVEIVADINIADGLAVRCDPTEINQVLMNLGRNAAHAMGASGGKLHIRVSRDSLDDDTVLAHSEMSPGPCVVLEVRDNGCGMDERTVARIFDPFFTTKVVGEGTGMGLSVVHGIMKDLGGDIQAASALGKGTSFSLYFPLGMVEQKEVSPVVVGGQA